jgi:hypothetical protein
MSDPIEDALIDWLRERGTPDPVAMSRVAAQIDRLPDRRRRRVRWYGAVATVAIAIVGVALIAPRLIEPIPASVAAPSAGSAAPPASLGPTRGSASGWASDLLGQLGCAGPPQQIGGELGAVEPVGRTGTASPYPWLEGLDDLDLPLVGWVESPKSNWETGRSRFARYINESGGRVVAVIVMEGDHGVWAVAAYRACAPSDFDPLSGRTTDDAPWTDGEGRPSTTVRAISGPAHCGWESTVWLFIDDTLFLRDPTGIFRDIEMGEYLPDASLPADADDTGLTSRDRRLFTTPAGDSVFVQSPTGIERWPRSTDPWIGCA